MEKERKREEKPRRWSFVVAQPVLAPFQVTFVTRRFLTLRFRR